MIEIDFYHYIVECIRCLKVDGKMKGVAKKPFLVVVIVPKFSPKKSMQCRSFSEITGSNNSLFMMPLSVEEFCQSDRYADFFEAMLDDCKNA